jgi:hypothetical protein
MAMAATNSVLARTARLSLVLGDPASGQRGRADLPTKLRDPPILAFMRKIAVKEYPAIAHHAGMHLRRELPRPLRRARALRDNIMRTDQSRHSNTGLSGSAILPV